METSIKPCVCEQLKDTNEWELVVGVGDDRSSIATCELTYLHELQHLLKLCKINFEFNI